MTVSVTGLRYAEAMETLALHFDFSDNPPRDDPDLSRFRQNLSRDLQRALQASGSGRWRGGRYAHGVVTIFIEAPDPQFALEQVHNVLAASGLRTRMTIGRRTPDCFA